MKDVDISVIIVNYNTCDVTKACLDSIFKYSEGVQFEVIVVDNDSTRDNSRLVLSNYPGIRYVQSERNLGFGKANNLGYKYANGRYILLLNSDTYLLNNALKFFVERFDNLDDNIACIGSILLSPDLDPVNSYNSFHSIKSSIHDTLSAYWSRLKGSSTHKRKGTDRVETTVQYIVGADLCIRKQVIEKFGLFDPDFFMYYEDVELQYRYYINGYASYIISGPQIVHLECVSSNSTNKGQSFFHKKIYLQGQLLYYKKRYSKYKYFLWRLFFITNVPFFIKPHFGFNNNIELLKLFLLP